MPRLMSVSLTEQPVRDEVKDVTRRLGWSFLVPGDRLELVRKAMGRRRRDGSIEPLIRIAHVRVLTTRREPLSEITAYDVIREGFGSRYRPEWWCDTDPVEEFIGMFTKAMRCHRDRDVTRIEWEYL